MGKEGKEHKTLTTCIDEKLGAYLMEQLELINSAITTTKNDLSIVLSILGDIGVLVPESRRNGVISQIKGYLSNAMSKLEETKGVVENMHPDAQRAIELAEQYREESITDPLTGLKNKRAFDAQMSVVIREGLLIYLAILDI